MSSGPESRSPGTIVEIVCSGVLDEAARHEFDGWHVQCSQGRIRLTGVGIDEAALHGALDRLDCLRCHLVGVEVIRYPHVKL